MNNIDKALAELYNELTFLGDNDMFTAEIFLNNLRSDPNPPYRQPVFARDLSYLDDFYLCMLYAGVADDEIISPSEKLYDSIESIGKIGGNTSFDPIIAVYAGKYGFAKYLMDIKNKYIYDRIIEEECWDFIDKITDCGKNKTHTEIMLWLLIKDYLRGKNNLFRYVARYNKSEPLTCGEAADHALLEINNVDEIFDKIAWEVLNIMNKFAPDIDRKAFNERAVGLMQSCARLGLKFKEFYSFNNILLPVYSEMSLSDNSSITGLEITTLPDDLTALIDENTVFFYNHICMKYRTMEEISGEKAQIPGGYINKCCFDNKTKKGSAFSYELPYLCMDFQKRYGHKPVIMLESYNDLEFLKRNFKCKELFDVGFHDNILEEFYRNINSLKKALNFGIFSQKNIDEITKYFVLKIETSSGDDHLYAVKRLNQLNNKLIKMGGRRK